MATKEKGKKQEKPKQNKTKELAKRLAVAARAMGKGKRKGATSSTTATKGSIQQMAYYLMNPSGCTAQRFATPYDGTPSSVVTLFNQVSVTLPTIVGTYASAGITSTTGLFTAAYFRDPLRAMVVFTPNTAAFSYLAVFAGLISNPASGAVTNSIAQRASDIFPIVPLFFVPYTGPQVHGPALFCGRDEESGKEGYAWLDLGSTLTATQFVSNTGDAMAVYAYDSGRDVMVANVSFSSLTAAFTLTVGLTSILATRGAYLRIEYLTGTSPSANQALSGLVISTAGASDVFAHVSIPGAFTHLQDLSMARVNSTSLLLQNCAAPMYREGTIQGASFDQGISWKDTIGVNNLGTMANSRNAFRGQLAKGSYSYLHVSERTELDYKTYCRINSTNGAIVSLAFPLNRDRFVVITAITAMSGSSFPGYDFFLQHTSSLEFQTTDQWYTARVSSTPSASVTAALDMVKMETQFFSNPTHLAQIGQFISGAGRMLKRHAGKLGGALSVLFPQYSSVFKAVSGALQD